jgi:hypothetical protein
MLHKVPAKRPSVRQLMQNTLIIEALKKIVEKVKKKQVFMLVGVLLLAAAVVT